MKKRLIGYWTAALLLASAMTLMAKAQDYVITDDKGNQTKISQQNAEKLKKQIQATQAAEAAKQARVKAVLENGQEIPRAEPVGPVRPAANGPTVDNRRKPENVVQWLENNNWQKFAEIRNGNVIMLRRSTDVPAAPDETVVFRWRSPTEFAQKKFLSSRPGHLPNRPLGPQLQKRIDEGTEFGD